MELLLGCGSRHQKLLSTPEKPDWQELVTLDFNADHNPDVVHDLRNLPLPFAEGIFDEIHAYEVLEHLGTQGDFKTFFELWSEFWRLLKPGGFFAGTSPSLTSNWLWGDPGHTRAISAETLTFLNQVSYTEQVGVTPMSDYRFCYKADFQQLCFKTEGDTFIYVMQAIKPSRMKI
jgi:SAM-dependent methyltransferase